jgi:hypothetical protein
MPVQDPKTSLERLKTHSSAKPVVRITIAFPDDRTPSETFELPTKGAGATRQARALNRILSKCVKIG